MYRETLDLLAHELGEIYHWEEECPGVYYLSILPTIGEVHPAPKRPAL